MLYSLAPGFHYWSEVWLEGQGWVPLRSFELGPIGSRAQRRVARLLRGKHRLSDVTQCMPLAFTGPMSVRFPAAWHLITSPSSTGMETCFSELDGRLIYSDHVSVQKL